MIMRGSHRNNSQTRHSRPILIPHSSLVASPLVTCGESKWSFVTRLGIIFPFHSRQATCERKNPVPSPQPTDIIIPIVSENLSFRVKRKALPMPSGQNEGTANFPYQILLVSFHLQYRNVTFFCSCCI